MHKAKKSLGQNFLKSQPALTMMGEAGNVSSKDTIIEIGPGKGALTEKLLARALNVIAVEKDRDLISFLEEKFEKEIREKKFILIEGDILEFDPKKIGLAERGYKLIANIPYNITGAILKKFFSEVIQPERMVLLVQKEVADRIVARDKKESILSLSVKAYGTPKYMMKVGKRFFSPAPKVDSAIIAITDIGHGNFKNTQEEASYFKLIKLGFAHKRKMLRGNLEESIEKELIEKAFSELSIDPKSRAEDLSFDTWLKLSSLLRQS